MFQFDAGTYDDTLRREGHRILTIAGNTQASVDFVAAMVIRSAYIPGVSNRAQAIAWMNGVRIGNGRWDPWIRTVTHYYNGCRPGAACFPSRFARYRDITAGIYREMGPAFWGQGACTFRGAIGNKYRSIDAASLLGACLEGESPTPDGMGAFNRFQRGSIYWSRETGRAHYVRGAIRDRWAELGWETGRLGYPTSDERPTPDGRGAFSQFQGGSIYWTPEHGAVEVWGGILEHWAADGWETGRLGYPTTGERATPDGRGAYNHFEQGSIYWSREYGAHSVLRAVRDKWRSMGWERSALGYPVTDEIATDDGRAAYNQFEHGSIYWTREHGAHAILRAIEEKYLEFGAEESVLAYPTTDETPTPDGRGAYTLFEGGAIYWSREHGAHEVHGAIYGLWRSLGSEGSVLGYPTSDELADGDARYNAFEGGTIYWTFDGGAQVLP